MAVAVVGNPLFAEADCASAGRSTQEKPTITSEHVDGGTTDLDEHEDDVTTLGGDDSDVMSTDAVEDDNDDEAPIARTESQCVKRLKVDDVAKVLAERQSPFDELRKTLSVLDRTVQDEDGATTPSTRFQRASDNLQQVRQLQQSCRNFGEDLMEGMLVLDQLSNLAEEDRKAKKNTLVGIQDLLDDIDSAQSRIARLQKHAVAHVERLRPATPTPNVDCVGKKAPRPAAQEQQNSSQLQMPCVDWSSVQLPVKFTIRERPEAYMLSAPVQGLDPKTVSLSREDGNVLSISGQREPSAVEQSALTKALSMHLQRLPVQSRQRLVQRDLVDMVMQLAHGRFGRFVKQFEVPNDVEWDDIDVSYRGGVMEVVLPRRLMQARPVGGGYSRQKNFLPYGNHRSFMW